MSDIVCAGPLERDTDFQTLTDPVTKTVARRFGTCGPTGTAMALTSALGRHVTLEETYSWERTHGWTDANGYHTWCDESGASTLTSGARCAVGLGGAIAENSGYNANWTDWWDFIVRNAGRNPGVVETSVGQVLVDLITGSGENATNLQYHFFAFLVYHSGGIVTFAPFAGRDLPEGVFVADGASFAGGNSNANGFNAADQLQFYSKDNIAQAKLCGGFALTGRANMLDLSGPAGTFFALNSDGSWHCKQTGMTVWSGMLEVYQTIQGLGSLFGLSDLGLPMTNEIPVGTPSSDGVQPVIQVFERAALAYDPHQTIDRVPGTVGNIYKVHLNHPVVLSVYAPKPAPAPSPTVQFGQVTESVANGALTVTVPYTVK